ncbi:hypothetical protein [Cryobacterium sp. CG_9.6]|uniref:hypothetical protein n=1 Tax=Cryobacterium sp. CG_9.6 TaxID=2760710 RepID=UPI0024745B1A|nr:hypothetical protein [Cryobacterium sp. CG_9.6]MDH6235413.1 hypothetical protein [Cryobacterium sp. CG_9.6]
MLLVTDPFAPPSVDVIAALRHQRALLCGLRDDVQDCGGSLSPQGVSDTWRGRAERAYVDRLDSLHRDLQALLWLLDDVLAEINSAIDQALAGLS